MLHRPKHAVVMRNLEGTECQVNLQNKRLKNSLTFYLQSTKPLFQVCSNSCYITMLHSTGLQIQVQELG